ncbi:MAG TPA: uroporphyrinogen decarboxylase family protein [Bryobacteraceae bacterium]
MLRRRFLQAAVVAAPVILRGAALSHKERVDRAMAGGELDRPPFTFWHHFGLPTAEAHAARTLEFHRAYRTDLVKVMSDFPYPKASGKWYELTVVDNPFPDQIRALELIRKGLGGSAYMIETVFNPFNVAQKLASKDDVLWLMRQNPKGLLNALDIITQSEIHHAKRAFAAGASGILFSVANAKADELSPADYQKFSRPFDKQFLDAVAGQPHTILHLHVEAPYLSQFADFKAPIINYSLHVSGIPMADVRKQFPSWVIAGGIDEVNYRKLSPADLRRQWQSASAAAGRKYILTPGCSVPNESTPDELKRLPALVGA